MREAAPRTAAFVYAVGFSRWKRAALRAVLSDVLLTRRLRFVPNTPQALKTIAAGALVVLWGYRPTPGLPAGLRVWRVEDGFLRSVGLGADLVQPLSWVVDQRGMYYNAQSASDLEVLLSEQVFDADLLARAVALRERIVSTGLTKYNLDNAAVWQRPAKAARVILVPGQVESDASLAFGAPGVRQNLALLQAVRSANPSAYVVYKPHPDVVAGLRAQGQGEQNVGQYCDEVLTDVPMQALFALVDEVHVMTSLAGFEALLRGKAVTCYGQPFYAGWGLTQDVLPPVRRTRRLSLDALVAGSLILYPKYMRPGDGVLVAVEAALDALQAWRARVARAPRLYAAWHAIVRPVLRWVVGVK